MNKEYLKGIFGFLTFLFGLFACILSTCTFQVDEPSYILALIISLCICLVGITSCILTYKRHKVILQLKENKLPSIARWQYMPKDYKLVEGQLEENRYISISIIFLIGVLGILVLLGLVFSSHPLHLLYAGLLLIMLIVFCSVGFYFVQTYYLKRLSKNCETIISDHYIYFGGELYTMQKGLYYLEDVRIFSDDNDYLQFIYGAPGTPYGPFTTLTIPIPEGELDLAYLIQTTYVTCLHHG